MQQGEDVVMPPINRSNMVERSSTGWLVKVGQRYYTGQLRSAVECWTTLPQLAKVYRRKRWAQTMAARLGGQAVPTAASSSD